MTTLIAAGEINCTYHSGSTPTVTLSSTAAEHCGVFADAGLALSETVDVCVVKNSSVLAVYRDAVYAPGALTLPTPLKAVGTLTDGSTVAVYAVSLVSYPHEDRRMLEQLNAIYAS